MNKYVLTKIICDKSGLHNGGYTELTQEEVETILTDVEHTWKLAFELNDPWEPTKSKGVRQQIVEKLEKLNNGKI